MTMIRTGLLMLSLSAAARAEPVEAHYVAYAAGLNVIVMDARLALDPSSYRLQLDYRTAGTFGLFVRSQQSTIVQGRFAAGQAVPQRFTSGGLLRGEKRLTEIDYDKDQPVVRQLVPPNDTEREAVPAAQQTGTIDTLSAMAQLIDQVRQTGRCDGTVRTFDGRRLAQLRAWTVGQTTIPASSLSSYAGPALQCAFEGRQLGGFMLNEDRGDLQRPQQGSAWFAAVRPGGPILPVRISFRTRWFGEAIMVIAPRE